MDVQKPFEVQSLILPDVLTVSQFRDRHQPSVPSSIQRLAFAILNQSLSDLKLRRLSGRKPGRPSVLNGGQGNEALITRKSKNYTSALAWLKDTRSVDLFGFNSVCELLGLEPGLLRRRLLQLLAKKETGQ